MVFKTSLVIAALFWFQSLVGPMVAWIEQSKACCDLVDVLAVWAGWAAPQAIAAALWTRRALRALAGLRSGVPVRVA